jgi:regulatory protein
MSSRQPKGPEREPHAEPDGGACKRHALDLLARRDHSRRELERKLAARAFVHDDIAAALDELEAAGLVAVERFVEAFVRSRVAKRHGPIRIRAELAERGVEAAASAAFLDDGTVDWHALAREARAKRFGTAPPADYKARAKQARFLQSRGFSADQIARALDVREDSD